MLESTRHHRFGAVECVGLCPAALSSIPHLGSAEGPADSHALVVRRKALVVQYCVAALSRGLLAHALISSHLDANPGQLAQKGSLPARASQRRKCLGPDLTQTGHSRTRFVTTPSVSPWRKRPKSRARQAWRHSKRPLRGGP